MLLTIALPAILCLTSPSAQGWKIGTPIATYWAGPPITDKTADQMKAGGFNLIWCHEGELTTAHRHGLRAMLFSDLLVPGSLDDPAKTAQLDALVDRVKGRPEMYAYFITDEPNAAAFPGLGKLVAHLREKDPAHLAYINLFPTYATNEQLGTKGDVVTAYREYLRLFIQTVRPDLLSFDHYNYGVEGDTGEYFLNLGLVRQAAMEAGIPFLNIVQASTWDKGMRAPNADELRRLSTTSLAYGAQGLSYFVYFERTMYEAFKDKAGQMVKPDGTPTALYEAAKVQLPEFVAVASLLQGLVSDGVYFVGDLPLGGEPLPGLAPFGVDPPAPGQVQNLLVGLFGKSLIPNYAYVVNLDYKKPTTATIVGSSNLEVFDANSRRWSKVGAPRKAVTLAPGGGVLVRTKG